MDRERFDALARLLAASGSRRRALGALLGVALLGQSPQALAKRHTGAGHGRGGGHDHGNGSRHDRVQAAARAKGHKRRKKHRRGQDSDDGGSSSAGSCCGAKSCPPPTPGSTRAGCDVAGQDFTGRDLHGATLRQIDGRNTTFDQADLQGAVFSEACLQGASFRGAELRGSTWGGACLIDADFTGAALGETTTFADAILCGTLLPDGTIDNRDCATLSGCCQRELGSGEGCRTPADCGGNANTCTNGVCTCGGALACTAPTAACCDCCGPNPNGVCVDLETDPVNCGACDNVCPRGDACTVPVCVAGQCGLAQAPDNTNPNAACPFPAVACCGGTCTDIFSNPNHCGTCGTQCFTQTCAITGCADGDCYFHGYAPLGQPGPGCATGQCCANECCTNPTPYCHPQNAQCMACTEDSHCLPGQECCNGQCLDEC